MAKDCGVVKTTNAESNSASEVFMLGDETDNGFITDQDGEETFLFALAA
jgi:hypothetical protein